MSMADWYLRSTSTVLTCVWRQNSLDSICLTSASIKKKKLVLSAALLADDRLVDTAKIDHEPTLFFYF
jgi:hypothetical protein